MIKENKRDTYKAWALVAKNNDANFPVSKFFVSGGNRSARVKWKFLLKTSKH